MSTHPHTTRSSEAHSRVSRWWGEERGGIALVLLLAFIGLAVPLSTATVQFAGQLNRNSAIFDSALLDGDAARAGVEVALWELRNASPPRDTIIVPVPGGSTTVTLTEGTTTQDLSDFAYADFVLSLDVSGSISSAELVDLKDAANTIVDAFDLYETDGRIRIGLVRFRGSSEGVVDMISTDAQLSSPAADHYSGAALHDGINGLQQGGPGLSSGTDIVSGIQGGAAQFATGLGDRPEVPNLLVLITDGNDTRGNSDTDIQNAMLGSGAEIFAVGVGAVTTSTLNAAASDPDSSHVFYANDFQQLLTLIDGIVQAVNDSALIGTLYDIEATAPDGSTIQVRALLTPDGDIVILSWVES